MLSGQIKEQQLSLKHWLLLSCCFSCFMVCIRIAATGYLTYVFLIWNLFLGFIPYIIAGQMAQNSALKGKTIRNLLLLLWLLFIPNSFYIVTDLFHLEQFTAAPRWFDLLLIFSFAWNGLVLGVISMRRIEMVFQMPGRRHISPLFVFAVMWLNAFGIYIGRYLRYNSWDVVAQSFSLFGEMLQILIHPFQNKTEWSMITIWAAFMTLLYITVKKMAESFVINEHS